MKAASISIFRPLPASSPPSIPPGHRYQVFFSSKLERGRKKCVLGEKKKTVCNYLEAWGGADIWNGETLKHTERFWPLEQISLWHPKLPPFITIAPSLPPFPRPPRAPSTDYPISPEALEGWKRGKEGKDKRRMRKRMRMTTRRRKKERMKTTRKTGRKRNWGRRNDNKGKKRKRNVEGDYRLTENRNTRGADWYEGRLCLTGKQGEANRREADRQVDEQAIISQVNEAVEVGKGESLIIISASSVAAHAHKQHANEPICLNFLPNLQCTRYIPSLNKGSYEKNGKHNIKTRGTLSNDSSVRSYIHY